MAYEQNLLLFEALKHERPWTLDSYRKFGGYEAWEKILREQMEFDAQIVEALAAEQLGVLGEDGGRVVVVLLSGEVEVVLFVQSGEEGFGS